MGLTCNIDARGKRARLISGIVQLAAALGVAGVWAWPSGSRVAWVVAAGLAVGGAFSVFEARAGWCALRAMGIKTRV
jgi:cyanate permease